MNKRFWSALLALMMVLTMAACRGKTEEPTQPEATEPTAAQDEIAVTDPTEAATEPTRETIPGEPDPYESFATPVTQDPTESTLPGDVDASLGVVPGEPTPDLEDDIPSTPGTSQQPTPGGSAGGSTQAPSVTGVTYETYIAMTGAQQQAFIDQFASVEEFVKWYNASKAKYEAEHPDIEIGGDTVIDGSQLMGG